MKVIICTWRIREWELQILICSSSVQPEIVPLFTISFQCLKKKFKSWQVYDWLAKWLIMSGYMDLRRPRVYRRSNVGLVSVIAIHLPRHDLNHKLRQITNCDGRVSSCVAICDCRNLWRFKAQRLRLMSIVPVPNFFIRTIWYTDIIHDAFLARFAWNLRINLSFNIVVKINSDTTVPQHKYSEFTASEAAGEAPILRFLDSNITMLRWFNHLANWYM